MLCESCGEYDANVHLTHVVNGVAREIHVCEECAAKHGIHVQGAMSLTDLLMGIDSLETEEQGPEKTCPFCKLALSELKKTSRLGCAVCYEVFSAELKTLLYNMQSGTKHVGKTPFGPAPAAAGPLVADLERKLEDAIAREDYETAAGLRDEIRQAKTVTEPVEKTS